ncbi:MAG: hypothetical protein OEY29_07385 [Gammaproteobacteria bacterium]|nr:hypothetical protein [Gammaproteobacteria bacterium]
MARKANDEDDFDEIDSDDAYDDFDDSTSKKHSAKRNHAARHRLEMLREEKEMQKLLRDEFYDYEDYSQQDQYNDWR